MTEFPLITSEALLTENYRYRNALLWIQMIAGMLYFGQEAEPEQIRQLANISADALADPPFGRDLPDFEARMEHAKEEARKMAEDLGLEMSAPKEEEVRDE